VQFGLVALIWGASFMFIRIELDAGIDPVHVALLRCVLGAAALFVILFATRVPMPRDPVLYGHLLVVAALMNAVPFLLFAFGETEVSSLLAGILNATTPLLTLVFSLGILPGERPTRQRLLGLLLGFAGVLVVLAPWSGLGSGSLLGALACLGAAACYGVGFPYMRRHLGGRPESSVAISAVQVGLGALVLACFAPLGTLPSKAPGVDAWLAILVLGVLGTGVAYIMNFNVVREAGAQTASMVTYLVPVFAVVFGVAILGEHISWHEPVGAAVIIAGVALAQGVTSRLAATVRG
jgi:drug/metabolite transporter (DMT)-like permease